MEREDAKDLTLSILVVVAVLLLADCIWLHVKSSRAEDSLSAMEQMLAAVSERQSRIVATVEKHHGAIAASAQEEPSFTEQAKETYNKIKSAAAAGYQAAKEEFNKK